MDKKVTFEYYDLEEFKEFLRSLPEKDSNKMVATIKKVERYGLAIAERQMWIRKLNDNIYEVRSKVASNITRSLYFHKEGTHYVITHGIQKKRQKTPLREINKADRRRKLYKKGK